MWCEAKDIATKQLRRASLNHPHRGIAILNRKRKVAIHEGSPHTRELGFRDLARKHQGLGAPAQGAKERAHSDLPGARCGQRLGTQLCNPRGYVPKRLGLADR